MSKATTVVRTDRYAMPWQGLSSKVRTRISSGTWAAMKVPPGRRRGRPRHQRQLAPAGAGCPPAQPPASPLRTLLSAAGCHRLLYKVCCLEQVPTLDNALRAPTKLLTQATPSVPICGRDATVSAGLSRTPGLHLVAGVGRQHMVRSGGDGQQLVGLLRDGLAAAGQRHAVRQPPHACGAQLPVLLGDWRPAGQLAAVFRAFGCRVHSSE